MQFLRILGVLAVIGCFALATTIESDSFDVVSALKDLNVDLTKIPALSSFSEIQSQSQESACSVACSSLTSLFGPKVSSQNSTGLNSFTDSFWSVQQEEAQPYCVFRPIVNTEVSTAVLLSRHTGCEFAARSGGHAAFTGASSSPGGISIWFKDMNEIALNDDRSVVSIGPGNDWLAVYSALEPYGLAAVGGRGSSIGVGGFVLGGGISYHSNLYGWACDNVESFEVVTANGSILTASENSSPDLYWALRGGGNNFGLVTKFNLYTIPAPQMYGGARTYQEAEFPNVVNAWMNVVKSASVDGYAQHWLAFTGYQGTNIASAELTYTKNESNPKIFQQYRSIPAVSDTSSSKSLVEYVELRKMDRRYVLLDASWVANVTGILPVMVYQGITEPMIKNMANRGGNALGLESSNEALHLIHISCWWINKSDDEIVYAFIDSFWKKVIAHAKDVGVYKEYIYMNYASMFQDPISGYGAANQAALKRIAKKYDPGQVYQTLQPGYFKLDGAPVTGSF
ncbi:unnamed protein product [Penicillium bialowiezense]